MAMDVKEDDTIWIMNNGKLVPTKVTGGWSKPKNWEVDIWLWSVSCEFNQIPARVTHVLIAF